MKTLTSLLERSQLEARTLLEKKESLLQEILHLETVNGDLETMNGEQKKELWLTSNQLNRMIGKYDALQKSSKATEEKLMQDIHELKLEYVLIRQWEGLRGDQSRKAKVILQLHYLFIFGSFPSPDRRK